MEPMKLRDIYRLSYKSEKDVVVWSMNVGLISKEYFCCKCGEQMKLVDRMDISDKCEWRCYVKDTNKHDVKRSIRKGSWFSQGRMRMSVMLEMLYMWVKEFPNKIICDELNVSERTVIECKMFCREVCVEICLKTNDVIGGLGVIVEIEESKFVKRKFNRGKKVDERWVIGGVEWESGRYFMKVIKNGTKEMLLQVLKENVKPGSLVISDCWKTYGCLLDERFQRLGIDHSLYFKDPDSCALSNTKDRTWSAVKRNLKGTRQVRDQLDTYLAEYIWRKRHSASKDIFKDFIASIIEIYPPENHDTEVQKKNDDVDILDV